MVFVSAFEKQSTSKECQEGFLELVCGIGLPMCDTSTDIIRPLPICKEYCEFIQTKMCGTDWLNLSQVLPLLNIDPLPAPNCSLLPSIRNGGHAPRCRTYGNNFNGRSNCGDDLMICLEILYAVSLAPQQGTLENNRSSKISYCFVCGNIPTPFSCVNMLKYLDLLVNCLSLTHAIIKILFYVSCRI